MEYKKYSIAKTEQECLYALTLISQIMGKKWGNPRRLGGFIYNLPCPKFWFKNPNKKGVVIDSVMNQLPVMEQTDNNPGYFEFTAIDMKKLEYCKHEVAGKAYADGFRAGLAIDLGAGDISESDALHVENLLKDVKAYLVSGDWITSKATLDAVLVDTIFTLAQKTAILSDMTDYITNEYGNIYLQKR